MNPNEIDDLSEYTFAASKEGPASPSEGWVSSEEKAAALGERGFYNPREPYYTIQHERPEHRQIIYLKALGLSHKEVAEASGFTTVAVSNICRQPWAREEILRIIQTNGENAVETTLRGAALDSVFKLIELRDSNDAPKETQRKAANDLLDRLFGKPNQPVLHSGNLDLSKLSDEELAKFLPATNSTGTLSPTGG